jgi:hypothetical protein
MICCGSGAGGGFPPPLAIVVPRQAEYDRGFVSETVPEQSFPLKPEPFRKADGRGIGFACLHRATRTTALVEHVPEQRMQVRFRAAARFTSDAELNVMPREVRERCRSDDPFAFYPPDELRIRSELHAQSRLQPRPETGVRKDHLGGGLDRL